jgi:DNA-nicking Smr family endonuclease
MKDDRSQHLNRPFKNLETLLKHRNISLAAKKQATPTPESIPSRLSVRQERALFLKAMADVTPLAATRRDGKILPRPLSRPREMNHEDRDIISALHNLVRHGEGFVVSQTPEYMESANPGAGREVLRRLHHGRYAIQDHVDLHGLTAAQAAPVLERFIHRSIERGFRAVLVVHGRGLTSPGRPVLKQKVHQWLTRSALRKWVIALTSARSCDGGAGATYVLLRRRPMTKSRRKKMRASN